MRQYKVLLAENRNFLWLWLASTISTAGDWFLQAAIYLHLYNVTGSAVYVGLLGTLHAGVVMLTGFFAGGLADRTSKMALMKISDLARFLLYFLLYFYNELVWVFAIMLLADAFDAVFDTSDNAFLPFIIDSRDRISTANALLSATENVMMFVAPALAGFTIALAGAPICFLINAATYLLSFLLLARIDAGGESESPLSQGGQQSLPTGSSLSSPSFWDEIREGVDYLASHSFFRLLIITATVGGIGSSVVDAMEVVYVDEFLKSGDYGYGMLLSACGAGALLGSLTATAAMRSVGQDILFGASLAVTGFSLLFYPVIPGLWFLLPVGLVQSIFISYYSIARKTMVQKRGDNAKLGRTFGLLTTLSGMTYLLSKGLSGFLAELVGVATLLGLAGFFPLLAGLIYLTRATGLKSQPDFRSSG